jgi:hypothetical protein
LFRINEDVKAVEVTIFLHDSMDYMRHLPGSYTAGDKTE